ncbi:MAG: glycoside hydrolase family 65 protein [Clostridiales bacterium]|nr:glycoside hydrolase family 65 protein [Clostridiales bacterium]
MNVWELSQEGYDPQKAEENGNRFFTGNGFVGVRGTLDEFKKDRLAAWNLAGVYDRHGDNAWREPVNAPNGFFAELVGAGPVLRHAQRLDLRHAVQSRETEYENAHLSIERFASQENPQLLCQKITVRPKAGAVTLRCGIDGDVWDLNGPHLFDYRCGEEDGVLFVTCETGEQKLPIAVRDTVNRPPDAVETTATGAFRVYSFSKETVLERHITINAAPVYGDYAASLRRHAAAWDALWAASHVELEGDEQAQLYLNDSLYHLHCIAPRHAKGGRSIPARGLSGQTYKGAVFWDTEIFLLPFFAYTEPALARKLVQYRIDTLPGALQKAQEYGYEGAFYAWESQEGGREGCTDFNVTDVFTGRPVRTYFRDKQIHISGDIVYALCNYADITGDESVLEDAGAKVVCQAARFYLSRAFRKIDSEVLEFTDVIGPDEYHDRVDNNAFTNKMAAFTIQKARELESTRHTCHQDAADLGRFDRRVRQPNVKDGIVEQFSGYFRHEDVTLAEVKSRLKHPREYWGTPGGVAYPTQIIKQADVIALMQLFPEEFTDAQVLKNWNYYEPRTEHGSSLSACMYALTACRVGKAEEAYPLFLKSAGADVRCDSKSWAGDVYIGGTHPAAAAGAWQIAIFGFAGLSSRGGTLIATPHLPSGITKISFPVTCRGRQYRVTATAAGASIIERD